MAVKIIDRIYNEIYTDGETDWLLGNVGEWQKLKLLAEVAIEYIATTSNPIQIDYLNNSFTLSDGSKWGQYGFDNGMIVVFKYKLSQDTNGDGTFNSIQNVQQQFDVSNVYGSIMEVVQVINGSEFDNIPTNFGTKRISDVEFYVDKAPEGCRVKYSHLTNENFQSKTLESFIDGTVPEFVLPDLLSGSTMEPVGQQSGMSIRSIKVQQVETYSNLLTSFVIPQSDSKNLEIVNAGILNDFDSIRSIISNITTPVTNYQSVENQNLLGQDSNGDINGGNINQAFLFDAPNTYSQSVYFDLNARITSINNSVTNNGFRFIVARFTNGSSMDFVEKTTLAEFTNISTIINKDLNYKGIKTFNLNTSDSLVLAVEYFDNNPVSLSNINYIMQGSLMDLGLKDSTLTPNSKRIYSIDIEYMISSLFEDISNFENMEIPSFLIGDGSLTDNFIVEFYPEWNNPNVFISNNLTTTERLGNTGWFDENFNQLKNDFKIDSTEYFDENGNPVDGLDYASKTKVKCVISGVTNLTALTECGFGFSWIPINDEDFKNLETPFYQNCFIQSGMLDDGFKLDTNYPGPFIGSGIDGASMDVENIRFTNSNGLIIFEGDFIPNSTFFSKFDSKDEDNRNYIIWMSVADGSLERNFSDRVSLLADFKVLEKHVPQAGEYDSLTNSFIEHPYNDNFSGVSQYKGIVQDDILCRMPFLIKKDGSVYFEKMTFGIEAFNIGLNKSFDLERYEVDLSQSPTDANNVQQFEIDQSRGFKLVAGNNKNWVKILRESGSDTVDGNGYLAYFATKIRWEDWLLNQLTPGDFFDANELNNGFNNDWVHYLRTQGWIINFYTEINATIDNELTQYKNQFKFTFNDYDENENISTTHKYFRNSDDTLLNIGTDPETGKPLGVILSNEPTRIEIEFEILDSGVWDISKTYAVTTIEIDKGAGRFEQRQLSSVWGSEDDNPLKPLENETKLKIEVDGTTKFLKTSCLIDPDLLAEGAKYRITGRVGCFDTDDGIFVPGLYEFRYEDLYE